MTTDVKISQQAHYKSIDSIAKQMDVATEALEMYGPYKAKLSLDLLQRPTKGKLILMTAINPTPAGEGKTTMNIGLSMALNQKGHCAISALREPSLGPVFGMKGGATGGGYAQVVPMEDINLHFTGDFHAITSCHNLLASMIDNHIYHGNRLNIDPKTIVFGRVMDMNDRWLRNIESHDHRCGHAGHFDITAASEIMAILCLAENLADLKARLRRIVVAYDTQGRRVLAHQLDAVGAMVVLLKDAIKPNLVQTLENTPAIIHGGPFANIAHGCNSVIASKMALKLADYVVTEAGFGADLGAEKFYNIKCRSAQLKPDATVLVATIRALKYNGGADVDTLAQENLACLKEGANNLIRHFENLKKFSDNVVIALNKFSTDTHTELAFMQSLAVRLGTQIIPCDVYSEGGKGALLLADAVVALCAKPQRFELLYNNTSCESAIASIAKKIYRAKEVTYAPGIYEKLQGIEAEYPQGLPVCIAKTQYSFSDNPNILNAPVDFTLTVRDVRVAAGAGFLVVLLGKIMTMPGMPKRPNAENMDIVSEKIIGLT